MLDLMQPDRRRCWRYQVDAGWAWVVCFASFFAHSVLFGTIQSFGTLFISLLNEFKSGESATGRPIKFLMDVLISTFLQSVFRYL